MAKLEIIERVHHTLDIVVSSGELRRFKIPSELTVIEIEKILEAQIKLDKLQLEQVVNDGSAQLRLYWGYIYNQLEVIFQHFHPEIDIDYLRKNIMQSDAQRILSFFASNRYMPIAEQNQKKTLKN